MSAADRRTIAMLQPPGRTSFLVSRYSAAALESLGHRVTSLLYMEDRLSSRLSFPGVMSGERAWCRRRLIKWLEEVEPELILVIRGARIAPSTIEWVKSRLTVPWACWFYGDHQPELPISTAISPLCEFFFTPDRMLVEAHRKAGATNVSVLPYAIHPLLHRPVVLTPEERSSLGCDVVFSGTINSENRRDVLEALVGFDLKVWGGTIGEYVDNSRRLVKDELQLSNALRRRMVGQWAWEEKGVRVNSAAKIVLNVLYPDNVSMRLFEVPGCGAFLLTDGRDYVCEFFEPEKEVALYDGPGDVADRVGYWLERPDERAEVAAAGQMRAHRDHTYTQRMRALIDVCFGPEDGEEARP